MQVSFSFPVVHKENSGVFFIKEAFGIRKFFEILSSNRSCRTLASLLPQVFVLQHRQVGTDAAIIELR